MISRNVEPPKSSQVDIKHGAKKSTLHINIHAHSTVVRETVTQHSATLVINKMCKDTET